MTDEQRRDTLAAYGNTSVAMPRLDRFAQSACVFDDAHCVSPVCTPSRGSLMTGLYPHAHGAARNNMSLHANVRCLPELLSLQDRKQYRIEYYGKWHLGDELYAQHGYERFISIEDFYFEHFGPGRDQSDRSDYHHFLLDQGFTLGTRSVFPRGFAAQLPERYGKPNFLADHACEFILRQKDRPWMLTVSMLEPHAPFYGPRDGQNAHGQTPLFPGFDHVPGQDGRPVPALIREKLERFRRGFEGHDLANEANWAALTSRYYGLCALVDTHMGRILDTLEATGQADRTVVVFTSDHGEMMGSHRLLTKGVPYREATAVPLLIRLPGQTQAVRVRGPVSQIDLIPTICSLLGHGVSETLHGRSLVPLLTRAMEDREAEVDATDFASPCVVVQDDRTRTLIHADGWRYTCYVGEGEHELYDLSNDPGELANLATDPALGICRETLHDMLIRWQIAVGDELELPSPETSRST